ncbi:hypothetical protein AAG570_005311 [Ranatra chinensis]|uniref:NHR domain-containing protein n=1 Tax=Ranatra chinensis TaxID=642074 RepID=A0ABD0Y044_9HEMI
MVLKNPTYDRNTPIDKGTVEEITKLKGLREYKLKDLETLQALSWNPVPDNPLEQLSRNNLTRGLISLSEIHFHSVHGRNARVTNGGKAGSRPRSAVEFNDAIVITNRPLRPGEMFSVVVERIVDRWSGSIAAG